MSVAESSLELQVEEMSRILPDPQVTQGAPLGISLFSGAGGMDIGAQLAGIQVAACVELDPNACDTLRHNHSKTGLQTKVVEDSIDNVPPANLMRDLPVEQQRVDVIFGGPPCQSFSQIGKQGSISDPRGLLLFRMIDYAEFFLPDLVVVENVRGLVTAPDERGRRGGVLKELIQQFESLGYNTGWRVLNAADFGVAQQRQRLFVVACRSRPPRFPEPTHFAREVGQDLALWNGEAHATVREALEGLGRPSSKDTPTPDSHVDVTPAGDIHRIDGVPEGWHLSACDFLPAAQRGRLTRKDTTKFRRLHWQGQSNTLRCGEIFFHPVENRYLTPREYMRLHGYPDDYELVGPIRGRSGRVRALDQHRLVANSVPPPLARAVFEAALGNAGLEHRNAGERNGSAA